MIINSGVSKSYMGSALYNEHGSRAEMKLRQQEAQEENRPYIPKGELYYSQYCGYDSKDIGEQMENYKKEVNPKLEKCAYTPSMNFAPEDRGKLSEEQKLGIIHEFAEHMGFAQNQYCVHRHDDKEHEHFHFVVNRIGFDGKTWNDSFSKRRVNEFSRQMEVKYDLRQVVGKSRERLKLTGKDENFVSQNPYLAPLRKDIDESILKHDDFKGFKKEMENRGYKVQTGFGLGYTNAKGVKIGSKDLGEGYKKNEVDSRIETGRLSREQERESLRNLQLQRGIEAQQRIAEVQKKQRLQELAQEREAMQKLQLQRGIEEQQRIAEVQAQQRLKELAQEQEAIQREKEAEEQAKQEKQKVRTIQVSPKWSGGRGM